jgi:hypothetical protein
MILSLTLPEVGYQVAQETIHKLITKPGDELRPGKLVLEHDLATHWAGSRSHWSRRW